MFSKKYPVGTKVKTERFGPIWMVTGSRHDKTEGTILQITRPARWANGISMSVPENEVMPA